MKASVIIPTYNRGYVICEALKSVLSQTYKDFEVIIIDDGSTDNTSDVVKQFSDPRIRYIHLEKNAGVAAARNEGIRKSRGELISFLDSDDLWRPDKLECNVAFLQRHPKAQAVFSDLEKFDGNTYTRSFTRTTPVFSKLLVDTCYPQGIELEQRFMYLCLLQEVPIKTPTVTIRREAVRRTGEFNEAAPSGEDWEFFLRIARFARFGYIDRPLAVVRVLGDATHRVNVERDDLLLLEVFKREARYVSGDGEVVAAARWGIANLSIHLAWYYVDVNRRKDAFIALLRGFWETRHVGLLMRSMAVCFPEGLRERIRRSLARFAYLERAKPTLPTMRRSSL